MTWLVGFDQESILLLGMQSQPVSSLGKLLLREEVRLNIGNPSFHREERCGKQGPDSSVSQMAERFRVGSTDQTSTPGPVSAATCL